MNVAVLISGQMRGGQDLPAIASMIVAAAGGDFERVEWIGALHRADARWVGEWPWRSVSVHEMHAPPAGLDVPLVYPTSAQPLRAAWEQWQGLLAVRALLIEAEKARGAPYDIVVRCRPDLAILEPMELLGLEHTGALSFARHNNWGGLNDRFFFGPSKMMREAIGYARNVGHFFSGPHSRHKRNCEGILAWHCRLEGFPIRRTRAVLQPRRADGTIDKPVFRADRGDIPLPCGDAPQELHGRNSAPGDLVSTQPPARLPDRAEPTQP